ncbi:hypothetical protein YC2023_088610 [Brassica napus]
MDEDSLADLEFSYLSTKLINTSTCPHNVSTQLGVTYKDKAENPNEAYFDLNKTQYKVVFSAQSVYL